MNNNMYNAIKHHLSDNILLGYSSGSLPEAFSLMVASHISLCSTCRAQLESFDAIGGEVLNSSVETDTPMASDSLNATLVLIREGPTHKPVPSRIDDRVLPKPIQDYIGGGLADVKWRAVGMGVKQAILPTSDAASARLLFIPAGAAMPDHGHQGLELTMVLQGAFKDEDDYFARGDVEMADSEIHHTPIADINEDCICLVVSDARLKFDGLIPKIMQRFAQM